MTKNLPASVRQRLTNKARETDRPFQEVLQYFAMERFLYRLSRSRHADRFVLKGALMFTAWGAPASRPTKDIDLLARTDNAVEAVTAVMAEVCGQTVDADGLEFDVGSVAGEAIKEDADYPGVRVTFLVTLQNARVSMQIDVGFGDVVTPAATMTDYPVLLDFAAPHLLGYPRETVVAEKFEAMTKLGLLNSRMKDFYDLWLLARQFDFDGADPGDRHPADVRAPQDGRRVPPHRADAGVRRRRREAGAVAGVPPEVETERRADRTSGRRGHALVPFLSPVAGSGGTWCAV